MMDNEFFLQSRDDKYGLNKELKRRTQQFWTRNDFIEDRNVQSSFGHGSLGGLKDKNQIKELAQKHRLGLFSSLSRKGSTALNVQKNIIGRDLYRNSVRSRMLQGNSRRIKSLTKLQK